MSAHTLFLFRQVLIGCAAFLIPYSLGFGAYTLIAAGGFALLLSLLTRNPWWWQLIHVAFLPAVGFFSRFDVAPVAYLVLLGLTALVFVGAVVSRVPLYLTGHAQVKALIELLKAADCKHVADLGAGIGSALVPISTALPHIRCSAYEIAPLSALVGRVRCVFRPHISWHLQQLASAHLAPFDCVYAYLSPEPMPELWTKACQEMRPGSLLVSNSFPIPDQTPERVLLEETLHPLFVYRIPAATR